MSRSEFDKQRWPYISERGELPPGADFALVGARFRNGRQVRKLTQRQVAEMSGVSQSVVSRFERGLVRRASAERIVRLALALGPNFPFGFCPHDDGCPWPRNPNLKKSFWDILNGR